MPDLAAVAPPKQFSAKDLFTNPMFLQFLAGTGMGLASGNGMQGAGQVLMQNLQNQQLFKLMKTMLGGGGIPEGGKVTHSDKGVDISVPSSALGSVAPTQGEYKSGGSFTPGTQSFVEGPEQQAIMNAATPTSNKVVSSIGDALGMMRVFNPFAGDQQISASDLAGLTSDDINKVMQFKFGQEELRQKSITDMMDMAYKQKLMDYYDANAKTDEVNAQTRRLAEGRQLLEAMTKDERTAAMKEYEYAREQGFQGTLEQWVHPQTTEDWKNYQLAGGKEKTGLEYDKWLTKHNASKATRISLGEKLEEASKMSKLQGQKYFDDPKWIDDLNSLLGSKEAQFAIYGSDNPTKTKATLAVKHIEDKIKAGGGTVVGDPSVGSDGRTIIWKVKWASGDTGDVRYTLGN